MSAAEPTIEVDEIITRYGASSGRGRLVPMVRGTIADLWQHRELSWILFQRDLKAQYRQSFLGYVWLLIPPFLTVAVWLFLSGQRVLSVDSPDMPYGLFLIIGAVVWQTFVKLVQCPLNMFNAGKPVFMKLRVPPEAFVVAGVMRAAFEFGIFCLLLVPVLLFYGAMPAATWLLIPLSIFALFSVGTACGFLLVPVGSLYSDIQQAVPVLLGFLMYIGPVVFPVPESGLARKIFLLNPMTYILDGFREPLIGSMPNHLGILLLLSALAVLTLLAAATVLRLVMPHLIARMGM